MATPVPDADAIHDVAIVGAGPAGCAAALAAARHGATAALLDRYEFPRDKPCGDGIAPEVLAVLDRLGVTRLIDGFRPVPRLRAVGPGGGQAARPMPTVVHTIPRTVFDARLHRAALAAGATFLRRAVHNIRERRDHVEVDDVTARVVIGADGARRWCAGTLAVR